VGVGVGAHFPETVGFRMQRLVNDVVSIRRIPLSYEDPLTTSQVVSKEAVQKKQQAKKNNDAKISLADWHPF
jgi:hypothetical protein